MIGLIGVTSYAGPCRVCEHPHRERITTALLAHVGALSVSEGCPDLSYRDVKRHERHCLPRDTGRMDKANEQRSTA